MRACLVPHPLSMVSTSLARHRSNLIAKARPGEPGSVRGRSKYLPVRLVAVQLLTALNKDQGSLASLLPAAAEKVEPSHQALLQEMVFGVCRWADRLELQLAPLMAKPLRNKNSDIKMLLMLGLYQLEFMRIAEHAALNETVDVVRSLRKDWARGLVNAVLRNHLRTKKKSATNGDPLPEADSDVSDVYQFAHPQWMIDQIRDDWPDHWQQILTEGNKRPPLTLRVNRLKIGANEWMLSLQDKQCTAAKIVGVQQAVVLDPPMPVDNIPGFAEGRASVQDGAAQLAVEMLVTALKSDKCGKVTDAGTAMRLLDACAAPGGKTGQLLEAMDTASVVALDNKQARLTRISENLERLGLEDRAQLFCADATSASDDELWWDEEMFDALLLDVPCSGSGVIRRQPDIKLLRQPGHLNSLAETQRALLDNLWPKLKLGGKLLYATCSVFRSENESRMAEFLESRRDAREISPTSLLPQMPAGTACRHGWQLLPGQAEMDGFFFCLIEKTP